ncbi:hypothetical protein CPC08DRAFT_726774 [Agrocybe pediades]|nr:hypothetical protein CPC08DRAFT_726774 [Agrocybe pediades]
MSQPTCTTSGAELDIPPNHWMYSCPPSFLHKALTFRYILHHIPESEASSESGMQTIHKSFNNALTSLRLTDYDLRLLVSALCFFGFPMEKVLAYYNVNEETRCVRCGITFVPKDNNASACRAMGMSVPSFHVTPKEIVPVPAGAQHRYAPAPKSILRSGREQPPVDLDRPKPKPLSALREETFSAAQSSFEEAEQLDYFFRNNTLQSLEMTVAKRIWHTSGPVIEEEISQHLDTLLRTFESMGLKSVPGGDVERLRTNRNCARCNKVYKEIENGLRACDLSSSGNGEVLKKSYGVELISRHTQVLHPIRNVPATPTRDTASPSVVVKQEDIPDYNILTAPSTPVTPARKAGRLPPRRGIPGASTQPPSPSPLRQECVSVQPRPSDPRLTHLPAGHPRRKDIHTMPVNASPPSYTVSDPRTPTKPSRSSASHRTPGSGSIPSTPPPYSKTDAVVTAVKRQMELLASPMSISSPPRDYKQSYSAEEHVTRTPGRTYSPEDYVPRTPDARRERHASYRHSSRTPSTSTSRPSDSPRESRHGHHTERGRHPYSQAERPTVIRRPALPMQPMLAPESFAPPQTSRNREERMNQVLEDGEILPTRFSRQPALESWKDDRPYLPGDFPRYSPDRMVVSPRAPRRH